MSKNTLQEYFQKKRLALPTYDHKQCGGPAHKPNWQSTIILFDGTKIVGDIAGNKADADSSAAKKALELLIHNTNNKSCNKNINSEFSNINSQVPNINSEFSNINSQVPNIN